MHPSNAGHPKKKKRRKNGRARTEKVRKKKRRENKETTPSHQVHICGYAINLMRDSLVFS